MENMIIPRQDEIDKFTEWIMDAHRDNDLSGEMVRGWLQVLAIKVGQESFDKGYKHGNPMQDEELEARMNYFIYKLKEFERVADENPIEIHPMEVENVAEAIRYLERVHFN